MGSLRSRLEAVRAKLENEREKPDGFAFIPEAIQYADLMLEILIAGPSHPRHSRAERDKLVGALGRIVLEEFAFAESEVGSDLLQIAEDFVDEKG